MLLIVSKCGKDTYSVDALFDGRSINGGLFPNGWSQFGTVDGSKEETDYPDMSGLRLILFTIYLASMPLDEVGESRMYVTLVRSLIDDAFLCFSQCISVVRHVSIIMAEVIRR